MPLSAEVCEQWEMPLIGEPGGKEEPWFLDWVMRKPADASRHVTAGYAAITDVAGRTGPVGSVCEFFGGMGAWARIAQETLKPDAHVVMDYHPDSVRQLQAAVGGRPGVVVVQRDAYQFADPHADVMLVDCGDLTAHRAVNFPHVRNLLNGVFRGKPKAVVVTDIAGARLHLNRPAFERVLGADCSSYPDYLRGFGGFLHRTYGYGVPVVFQHRWSAVMVCVPGEAATEVREVPERPVGLSVRSSC